MIYFIQAGSGEIKIGYTTQSGKARLKGLQTASPTKLMLLCETIGTARLEKQLHERFAHLRLTGEWFKSAPELLEFIEIAKLTPADERLLPRKKPGRPTKDNVSRDSHITKSFAIGEATQEMENITDYLENLNKSE